MAQWRFPSIRLVWLGCLLPVQVLSKQTSVTLSNTELLCGQYQNFTTSNGLYTLFTNQWGADGSGSQCMTVGNSPSDQSNYTAFSATWSWEKSVNSVHAYPNANLESSLLPLRLDNLSSLQVDLEWSYTKADSGKLADGAVTANVAMDMFLDTDPTKAKSTTEPSFEVMVWIGDFGQHPIGFGGGVQAEKKLHSDNFKLYIGSNPNGQRVFTWLASSNHTSFHDDISPLIRRVAFHGGPNVTDYLGVVQFGSEALHTLDGENVTFSASEIKMNVTQGVAPLDSRAINLVRSNLLALMLGSLCVLAVFYS